MIYITINSIVLEISYTEPVYDHAPDYATYSSDHTISVPPLTGINLDNDGNVLWCDMKMSFGVSMYPGTIQFITNLSDKIDSELLLISESEYDFICNCRYQRKEIFEDISALEFQLDFLQEESLEIFSAALSENSVLSHMKYETTSAQLYEYAKKIVHKECLLTHYRYQLMELDKCYEQCTSKYLSSHV